MANPGSIVNQIGGSFEDIGKDIARETVQAPKDIAGAAMESLGVSTGKKNPAAGAKPAPATPLEAKTRQAAEADEATKRAIARAALEELVGKKREDKEPGVREKIEKEEEEKKEMEKKQKELAAKQALPQTGSKRPKGDLYGVKAKKTSTEQKSVRQD